MTSEQKITVWQMLGSRSFLDPKFLLYLVAPFAIFASILTADAQTEIEHLIWLFANIFAITMLVPIIAGFRFSWRSFFPDFIFPLWSVVLISAILGLLKAFFTVSWVREISQGELLTGPIQTNLFGGATSAIGGLLLASVSSYLLAEFKKERELLITAKLLDRLKQSSAGYSQKLEQLSKRIRDLVRKLEANPSKELPKMELGLIKKLIDSDVRPLATGIYNQLDKAHQSFAMGQLAKTAFYSKTNASITAAGILSVIPRTIDWFGPLAGSLSIVIISLMIYAGLSLGNWVFESINFLNPFSFYFLNILIPQLAVFSFIFGFDVMQGYRLETVVYLAVSSAGFSTIVGMASAALNSATEIKQDFKEVRKNELGAEYALLDKQRRALANQIHGEVQSRLMNIVLNSEAHRDIQRELAIKELVNIADLIDRGPNQNLDFEKSIQRLQNTWDGFTKIHFQPEVFDTEPAQQSVLFAIIEEGVANAFKHGLATEVSVSIDANKLMIADNGLGPKTTKPGVGTKILNSVSSDWKLSAAENGGSVLEVSLDSQLSPKLNP